MVLLLLRTFHILNSNIIKHCIHVLRSQFFVHCKHLSSSAHYFQGGQVYNCEYLLNLGTTLQVWNLCCQDKYDVVVVWNIVLPTHCVEKLVLCHRRVTRIPSAQILRYLALFQQNTTRLCMGILGVIEVAAVDSCFALVRARQHCIAG